MNEIWKDIPGYEGFYQVSNLGRVYSCKRKVKNKNGYRTINSYIKKKFKVNGYYSVNLSKKSTIKSKKVHQLVAMAFLNHTPCGYNIVVDHINNIKTDNRVENLQLISNRENSVKDIDKSSTTSKYIGVYFHKIHKKWISRIYINGNRKQLGSFDSELEAYLTYKKELKLIL